jgi:6-phosphofructokinase 1
VENLELPLSDDLRVQRLGACTYDSPLSPAHHVPDDERVLQHARLGDLRAELASAGALNAFELAGARSRLFFDPTAVRAGIVTCGGLCPGLNDVIRALVMTLWRSYGVRHVVGFRYGFRGITRAHHAEAIPLDPEVVDDIHQDGGTILGSSRGARSAAEMVDVLYKRGINMLFTVGGDGTQRGALTLVEEAARRDYPLVVVGVPKTIDNDIEFIERSFGFETAVEMARDSIRAAHAEAKGVPYGIGLVKLMGRHSGFIAAHAALANSEVDLALVPEVPFALDGADGAFARVADRLRRRQHAVVVVAEGAGQDLLPKAEGSDASGNAQLTDIGPFLRDRLVAHFADSDTPAGVKYLDPSYAIRSLPANAEDSVFCQRLAQNAVHAAMSGRTGMIVGSWNGFITHVPTQAAVGRRKTIGPEGRLWRSVVQATGQGL